MVETIGRASVAIFRTQVGPKINIVDTDKISCCPAVLCPNYSACVILDAM
jgi:hypothetical protein